MRNAIALIIIASAILTGQAALAAEKASLDIPVKKIYSAPDSNSNLILDIPVEVKLQDISPDGNWYKVKIAYAIGPFCYTYEGWAAIPVADIMAERDESLSDIAHLLPEE